MAARLVLAAILASLFSVVAPGTSWACSCAAATVGELASSADLVARVDVLAVGESQEVEPITYTVRPTWIWRGAPAHDFDVLAPHNEAACGLSGVRPGEDFLLLGMVLPDGAYETNLCSGSQPATDEALAEVADTLGEGGDPAAGTPSSARTVQPGPEPSGEPGQFEPEPEPDWFGFTMTATVLAALLGVVLWQIFSGRRPPAR
jgi:hypothetical protein